MGDIAVLRNIWSKTNGNREIQKRLLNLQDKDNYNAFLMAAKNGSFKTLGLFIDI